jgi:hypothetical protein
MFKYFKIEDFNCQETGDNEMDIEFIKGLDNLRAACGFPFVITSGFRSKEHSLNEPKKHQVRTRKELHLTFVYRVDHREQRSLNTQQRWVCP